MSAYGNSDAIREGQIRMLSADMEYVPGVTYTVTLDGFITSDNIECTEYENVNTGYSYSDHDPVYTKFKLLNK